MGKDTPHRKQGQVAKQPNRLAEILPILIMLAIIAGGLISYAWITASNPVNRYNKHLNKGMSALQDSRYKTPDGEKVDAIAMATAHKEFLTALEYGERALGPTDSRLETVFVALLNFAVQDEDWEPAKEYGERLLQIQLKKYGDEDQRLVQTYGLLAKAARGRKDMKAVEEALKQVAVIKDDVSAAYTLAMFYVEQKEPEKALPLLEVVISANLQSIVNAKTAKRADQYRQALQFAQITVGEYVKVLTSLGKKEELKKMRRLREAIKKDLENVLKQQFKPSSPAKPLKK